MFADYILIHDSSALLKDLLRSLKQILEGQNMNIRLAGFMSNPVAKRVCDLLGHADDEIASSALQVVGNILSGSDAYTTQMVDIGVI
jgi:chemotaxis protein CheY-P-specific phosphatase CheC